MLAYGDKPSLRGAWSRSHDPFFNTSSIISKVVIGDAKTLQISWAD